MIFIIDRLKGYMKNLFVFFSAAMLTMSACSDQGNPPKDGEDQVPQPVENSGPNTEGQRAVEATVNDSSKANERSDTTAKFPKDSTR
jgi:hypothetical protein